MEDKRFAHIATDPKFRRIPKHEKKVKIDKRFQSMFSDKKFKVKYTVDKRGRPVNHTSNEDLKRYYELSSGDENTTEDEQDENIQKGLPDHEPGKFVKAQKPPNSTETSTPDNIKKKLQNLKVDYARGEAALFSESSSDDETDEEDEGGENEDEQIDHKWGELDNDASTTEEATYRLAACNMDWDRIRAVDLMVLLNSFLPAGGVIQSVTIYPSEYGKKRMQEEEVKGPSELVESKKEEGEEGEEGSKYHMEKLRKYQLNRLKYYYAVINCDSVNSANKIYSEVDGMEYESTATKIDLRFIPDEMKFDEEAKESCDSLPELNKYQPRFFTTTALQQAKVDLTWDETDPSRIEVQEKLSNGKIDDISKSDLQNYLAVSSEGEESDTNSNSGEKEENLDEDDLNPIAKYKLLLQEIEDKEQEKKNNDVGMEVSWGIDLKDKTEKLVKKKLEEKEDKTPFERFLDKRKEKRKEKKKLKNQTNDEDSDIPSDIDMDDPYFAEEFNNPEFKKPKAKQALVKNDEEKNEELELLLMNEEDEKGHFSLKKIQEREAITMSKKRKNKKQKVEDEREDGFEVNVNDERFSAIFTSHLYNIDPTDSNFKKTKAMETLITEKIRRRVNESEPETKKVKIDKTVSKNKAELNVLVKSIKRKTALLNKK